MASHDVGRAHLVPHPQMHTAADSGQKTKASFLTLPRELRDIIYEYAFNEYTYIPMKHGRVASKGLGNGALMLVCWQLHDEALPSYYKNTKFTCFCSKDLVAWLKRLPSASRYAIRHIMYGGALELWNVTNYLVGSGVTLQGGVVQRVRSWDWPKY